MRLIKFHFSSLCNVNYINENKFAIQMLSIKTKIKIDFDRATHITTKKRKTTKLSGKKISQTILYKMLKSINFLHSKTQSYKNGSPNITKQKLDKLKENFIKIQINYKQRLFVIGV